MALKLSRREGENVRLVFQVKPTAEEIEDLINNGITIWVSKLNKGQTRLAIRAPDCVNIVRGELLERATPHQAEPH
jgi:sRNA-binding carbon storage regulator CsrA